MMGLTTMTDKKKKEKGKSREVLGLWQVKSDEDVEIVVEELDNAFEQYIENLKKRKNKKTARENKNAANH